ncbi:hypothetical protein [Cohnella sp.]|uniref:hypothetical protein n=1 Tax=Cohnella sp. TaxID=1883426 RepID=UPI0035614E0D
MNNKRIIVLMTAVGLLGAAAGVGASGMVSKVTGVLHKNIAVSVNGTATSMHPVYIQGKAYLPARDTASALGYNLNWSSKTIELNQKEVLPVEVEYLRTMGVIVSVEPTEDEGRYRLEVLGKGPYSWIILYADKETELTDSSGAVVAAKDLKAGMRIEAEFGPMIAMSFPGQSHAAKIIVGSQSLVKEDAIQSVTKTDDGWQVQFGEVKNGVTAPALTLNAGKETSVLSAQGQPVEWADLKMGTKVRAYYGPLMTKSIPPQSPLHYLVVLDEIEQLAPASAQEFRELAWSKLTEDNKTHLITKKDEAKVEVIDSKNVTLMATTDAQKKMLADIQTANGKLITVTFSTDDDALLGPLTLAFDPDSKELIGLFARK